MREKYAIIIKGKKGEGVMYTEKQIEEYKERIHYHKKIELTKEVLDELIYAHQCSIPFENLDVYDLKKEIVLTEEALYHKFIVQKRGGYCFEMNGFFCKMLQSMGFQARPCLCRVMFGLTDPAQNLFDHRGTIVTLDGKDYFCEVGLGGAMPPAAMEVPGQPLGSPQEAVSEERLHPESERNLLPVDGRDERQFPSDVWQQLRGEEFCIRAIEPGWYGTMRRVYLDKDIYDDPMDRKERLEVMFSTITVHEMDFISLNYYLSHAEQSLFLQHRKINLRTTHGYRALTDLMYREVTDGVREERELNPEELPVILKEKFGLELSEEQITLLWRE